MDNYGTTKTMKNVAISQCKKIYSQQVTKGITKIYTMIATCSYTQPIKLDERRKRQNSEYPWTKNEVNKDVKTNPTINKKTLFKQYRKQNQ